MLALAREGKHAQEQHAQAVLWWIYANTSMKDALSICFRGMGSDLDTRRSSARVHCFATLKVSGLSCVGTFEKHSTFSLHVLLCFLLDLKRSNGLFCILAARNEQLAKVLGTSPVLLPKKLKTKHLHVTDHCLATTELAREVALLPAHQLGVNGVNEGGVGSKEGTGGTGGGCCRGWRSIGAPFQ